MKNSSDSPLEERPNILDSISMNVSGLNVLSSMTHGAVDKLGTIKPQVGTELVSVDLRAGANAVADESSKGSSSDVLYRLEADFT